MAIRGIGAKPLSERGKLDERPVKPWEEPGLTRAGRVIAFLEDLPITAGKLAGTKMQLRPWQRDFIEDVYAEDGEGHRPVRTAVLSMARKNGKTQLAAGLALCHLMGPEAEPRGEVYSAALTRDQAAKLFQEMVAILQAHPELDDRANIIRFNKQIEVLFGDGAGSIYAALSADAGSKMGLSPSFVVYDELGSAPNRDLFDALDTATGARDNPLMVCISTQAAADHHVFSELIDYGQKVQAGDIEDPSFHLTLYAAPQDADPWSREAWLAANPALGDFRSLDDVQRQAAQARLVPSKESAFRNLILNQRVSAVSRFIHKAEWDRCREVPDLKALEGRECYGGLDLSGSRDLTAFVLAFPSDDRSFDVLCQFFMPEANIVERSNEDRVPYDLWARQGFITLIPGSTIDPSFVAQYIMQATQKYAVQAVAYDRWRIEDLKRELGLFGGDVPLEPFGQGFKDMSPAVDTLERHVAEKLLRHGSNPVLNMCAANGVVTRDPAGSRKLDKSKATGRIDGLVALAMALQIAGRFEPEAMPACLLELMED
ncbi:MULTISPECIES: terminase TerL endonuclease subunit [unclassified Ochrobactrum]|uniref:terminase large subunit n=1 Tax=unclassified Ochrobactrum TaxID=239106 RepID=UPI000DEEDA82|nr:MULTISPECIES: terminase TerL endonuclease subunit [unclassified Ochrobactrum]MBQ0708715.1 terminase large subunit [Ochrobactrum sp. AP1BH01-1]